MSDFYSNGPNLLNPGRYSDVNNARILIESNNVHNRDRCSEVKIARILIYPDLKVLVSGRMETIQGFGKSSTWYRNPVSYDEMKDIKI